METAETTQVAATTDQTQTQTSQQQAGQVPPTPASTGAPGTDDTALNRANREIEQLRKEAAARRVSERNAKQELQRVQAQKLASQGKYKDLYEQEKQAKEALEAELEPFRASRAQQEAQEAAERDAILAKIPDDIRETFKTMPLAQLKIVQERIAAPNNSQGAPPQAGQKVTPANNANDGKPAPKLTGREAQNEVMARLNANKG